MVTRDHAISLLKTFKWLPIALCDLLASFKKVISCCIPILYSYRNNWQFLKTLFFKLLNQAYATTLSWSVLFFFRVPSRLSFMSTLGEAVPDNSFLPTAVLYYLTDFIIINHLHVFFHQWTQLLPSGARSNGEENKQGKDRAWRCNVPKVAKWEASRVYMVHIYGSQSILKDNIMRWVFW